ncbi:hypothetical protein [Phaeocystidibacter marisrubri]|uniref:Uncharacterized protein n=1 Tax=Phaeocystidibacter marisrubri TaxID=1577780 RepID=A0A6L3ZDS6_9FLAO|nr:hypothetical protein [Phaeocystidibacter marisrubri]KAB2815552.1 hypothetical protein F8C82_07560 [Phaeocystidibacter marisrubri]GGH64496.1 hypothetical protein GCM10011318_00570 [Phaeocystidibacter marisrubri]
MLRVLVTVLASLYGLSAFSQQYFAPCNRDRPKIPIEDSVDVLASYQLIPALLDMRDRLTFYRLDGDSVIRLDQHEYSWEEQVATDSVFKKTLRAHQFAMITHLFAVAAVNVEYSPDMNGYADGADVYITAQKRHFPKMCAYAGNHIYGVVDDFVLLMRRLKEFVKSDQVDLPETLQEDILNLTEQLNRRNLNPQDPTLEDYIYEREFPFFEEE